MGDESAPESPGLEPTEIVPPTRTIAGKYQLGRLIGEGGMGTVYEAEHTGLGVKVAIKVLGESFAEDQVFVRRFRREARASAAVRHENVVAVTDTGTDEDGVPFLVMELLDGENLSSLLRREKIISPETSANIARQVLRGLGAAHQQGVVHRDLKPANVFLAQQADQTQRAKILDFGISKFAADVTNLQVTAEGAVIGTPSYMAPEQVKGESEIDGRVDIYAVGVMLYRMTTGKLPFAGKRSRQIYDKILVGNPIKPREIKSTIPEELEAVILKAMAPSREDRYRDADEMIQALSDAVPNIESTDPLPLITRSSVVPLRTRPPRTAPQTKPEATAPEESATGPTRDVRKSRPLHPSRTSETGGSDAASGALTNPRAGAPVPRTANLKWAGLAAIVALVAIVGWMAARGDGHTGDDPGQGVRVIPDPDPLPDETVPPPTAPAIRYGVNRYESPEKVNATHQPIADHLAEQLGRPVDLLVLEDYELRSRLAANRVDLAALSAYRYVTAKRDHPDLRILATAVSPGGPSYQGLIIAKAESGISSLSDLTGRVFCYVSDSSASGYLFPRAVFRQAGVDPDTAFRTTHFTSDHMRSLHMLDEGRCDGAAVFQGIFGETDDFVPQQFTTLATTPRIRHDAYVVAEDVPDETADALRDALLALERDGSMAQRVLGDGSVRGFVPATDEDYDSVREVLQYLDDGD